MSNPECSKNRPEMETPEYRSWRFSCLSLFSFKCGMCGENSNPSAKDLEVHHIKRWADYPKLRYSVSNGIPLCREHHEQVTGRETQYEHQLRKLVVDRMEKSGKFKTRLPKTNLKRGKWRPRNPRLRG